MTEFPGQSIVEIPLSYCSQNTHGQQGTYENKSSQVKTNKTILDSQAPPIGQYVLISNKTTNNAHYKQ